MEKTALYFGRSASSGHYLRDRQRREYYEPRALGMPWTIGNLDTGLLKNGKHIDVIDGRVFWTCGGDPLWFAFFWWDRSGDKRANSNSGFYVRGFEFKDVQAAFDYACSEYPIIVNRQTMTLQLQLSKN